MMAKQQFKMRVKDFKKVKPTDLVQNEKNFRAHSVEQQVTLSGIMSEIGFAGAIITRELPNGKFEIIDGHLRADLVGNDEIPIIITDLNDVESKKLLATYDAVGDLADLDNEIFTNLIENLEFDNRDVDNLIGNILDDFKDDSIDKSKTKRNNDIIEEMELTPLEHYDYIVVLAKTRNDWNVLCSKLGLKKVRKPKSKRIGLGRAVEASKLLALLKEVYDD